MIITRSPLRITLGGGGSDLPASVAQHGGFCLTAAITKYVYLTLHPTFDQDLIVKYSEYERVADAKALKHPLVREALGLLEMDGHGLEIVSHADIPAGTGLGSSSAFTAALLKALRTQRREVGTRPELAADAAVVECERAGVPIGKQDHYATALGGIHALTFCQNGRVSARALKLDPETTHHLEDHLLLFFTGYRRQTADVLTGVNIPGEHLKALGQRAANALETGALQDFGQCFRAQWDLKQHYKPAQPDIVAWHDKGEAAGAFGKLVGAGRGGFLLFYAPEPARLRTVMRGLGLPEVRFGFDWSGTSVVTQ